MLARLLADCRANSLPALLIITLFNCIYSIDNFANFSKQCFNYIIIYKNMTLSKLQRYIMFTVWESTKTKVSRQNFHQFYAGLKKAPNKELQANIITKSIARLIDRGLLVGFGTKTQHKLFIESVKLSPGGKKNARLSFCQQATFPWPKKR